MRLFRAQGATQLSSLSSTTYCPGNRLETVAQAELRFCCAPERCDVLAAPLFARQKEGLHGQAATEYLVLLAVVLIIALVSVALLGFFPGMASDAQVTQLQMYWKSATPIAIVESGANTVISNGYTYPYLRIRNTGTYSIRITGIVGADGIAATQFLGSNCGVPSNGVWNASDYFYLGPGEEKYLAYSVGACDWRIISRTSASATYYAGGATSICQNSSASPGTLDYKSIGFDYIQYFEGQQVTKRQIGKDFVVKCGPPI